MFLVGVLRHFAAKLMVSERKADLVQLRESQAVLRAQRLRSQCRFIPSSSFTMRRQFFTDKEKGIFQKEAQAANPQAAMMGDPTLMMDMMKKNMSMVVPQILIATWVNFFYSGFITAKVPFPLTPRFRGMLQRGVELQSLDVTYVSSLSWYFLNLFGLRGLFSLVLGENTVDDTQMAMQMQQQMATGMDTGKAYVAEREGLDLIDHEWALNDVDKTVVSVLKRKLRLV